MKRGPKTGPAGPTQHIAVRVETETIARVDALADALSTPWRKARRSDAMRAALHEGLIVLEARHALAASPAKKGGRK